MNFLSRVMFKGKCGEVFPWALKGASKHGARGVEDLDWPPQLEGRLRGAVLSQADPLE